MQNIYITMIYTMRCCKWIVDSLRSTRCEEYNSSRIPPNLNETSIRGNILQYNIFQLQSYLKKIKNKFIEKLILKIYRLELLIRVKIDLLDFILKVYIVQKYKDKIQHLVAYYSRKLIPLELNYNIYNKELLAIVIVLKEQRAFL